VVSRYAGSILRREPEYRASHNPLGGWSIMLMLSVLLLQAATGLFASDDLGTVGPLADHVSEHAVRLLTRVHKYGKNVLVVLIALHLFGVAWHAWFKRETLIRPMFTGRRELPSDPGLRFASPALAIVLALASGALVWALVTLI
jgi:cytochrome b